MVAPTGFMRNFSSELILYPIFDMASDSLFWGRKPSLPSKANEEKRAAFWDHVCSMIGDPHMDPARRAVLNEFGLVQHAVFQSPDHNTVHVIYGHTNKHFVHSELTEELKTRTGLQLVPPQSRVATSLSSVDSVLIVIVDRHDSVTDRLLREAVETSGHSDTQTLFIRKGGYSDWVDEKLPRSTLMLYHRCMTTNEMNPRATKVKSSTVSSARSMAEHASFWENLCNMIGDRDTHPTRRAMLNEFGLVQHAVLLSPDHNTVHVVYGHTNKHFVHSELTEELKTRTGLQLVPPPSRVATSSSTVDSVLIVIVDRNDSVTDRLLRQAVETSGSPHANSLFMQMGEYRPHWVEERLSDVTLMMYPMKMVAMPRTEDERPLFWESLSTIVGDPHMDPERRAMLNEFGLVQHAVLQSPDHNTVHVIYGHPDRDFVHSELTEELKTRTGLQLVPPQSRVATSTSTVDSVLIVIVDRNDSVTDKLLREAVETSGHSDTQTLFIRKGGCSDWVDEKLPRSTLMVYHRCMTTNEMNPRATKVKSSTVSSARSMAEHASFWENLCSMIGDRDTHPTRRAMLNEFGLVQHAVLLSPDHNTVHVVYGHTNKHFVHSELTEELKTRTGLQLVPPPSRVATSSSTADSVLIVIVDRNDSVTDRLLRQAVETSGSPHANSLFMQMGKYRPHWVEERLSDVTLMMYPMKMVAMPRTEDERPLFWESLSTIVGDPHMDPTRRAMLNEFGLVQHAVFQSPDHNTVHVIYDHTNKHFVQRELTKELKTRTGLQLVSLHSRVATSSYTADSFLIVVVDSTRPVTNRMLRQAVETSRYLKTHTLFMQMGEYRPHWVEEKLSSGTLMLYPMVTRRRTEDELALFWEIVSTIVGDPHMDPTRCSMLNEFGLVQHAVLQSPDHNTVHVIYGHPDRDFVHSELTEELKTRTGLQLVPPQSRVATSSSTADIDSVLIVIVDRNDPVTDRLLREAVETSGHPESHTLFIGNEEHLPGWVKQKHSSLTLIMPLSDLKQQRLLETLDIQLGGPRMDSTCRTVLKKIGLVQHAVLQSPDHNTVHVIYGHTNKHFVHSELTEELKTRTGLQLVPPQSRVATSSSTADSVLIVVIACHDLATDSLLREAVETSGHQDTHTLFIQKSHFCPAWVAGNCPLIQYPLYGSVKRSPFWEQLSNLLADRLKLLQNPLVEAPSDVRPKSSHGLSILENTSDTSLHVQGAASGQEREDYMNKKRTDIVRTCTTTQGIDKNVSSKAEQDNESGGHQINHDPQNDVPSYMSQKCPDSELVVGSWSGADKVSNIISDHGKDSRTVESQETQEQFRSNQNQDPLLDKSDFPSPIFSRSWQHNGVFSNKGGVLHKPGSDVILQVQPEAVSSLSPVAIYTAICADIDRVHSELELSDEEQVVSPLAEYWAGPDFSFQRPVCITLPLCLPPDPDFSLLRVYRVSRRHDGHVIVTRVKDKEHNIKECLPSQQDISNDKTLVAKSSVSGKNEEHKGKADTEAGCSDQRSVTLDNKYQHSEGQRQQVGYAWEESGHYEVSSEGQVLVTTGHFCGYVCVYCGHSQGPPELVAMVYGCHKRMSSLQRLASVDLYIWDKRIDIGDFRQEYDIGITGCKVGRKAVSFLDELKDSKVYTRMDVLGSSASNWTHLQRSSGQPGNLTVQHLDVKKVISCDKDECTRKKSAPPHLVQWRLEAPVSSTDDALLLVVLDIAHITGRESPTWEDRQDVEKITCLSVEVKNDTNSTSTQTDGVSTHDTLVKRRETAPSLHAASNGVASGVTAHPVPVNGSTAFVVSRSDEALDQVNNVVGLRPEDIAQGSTSGALECLDDSRQVESLQGSRFINCTISVTSNTHNNNVSKLGKMNTGNTSTTHYNIPGEAEAEALDYPQQQQQGDINVVEMPNDASLLRLREPGQGRSGAEIAEGIHPQDQQEIELSSELNQTYRIL